ncbi:MAG: hypothetical protein WCJ33_06520 [Pseudomonadota bacterium]
MKFEHVVRFECSAEDFQAFGNAVSKILETAVRLVEEQNRKKDDEKSSNTGDKPVESQLLPLP